MRAQRLRTFYSFLWRFLMVQKHVYMNVNNIISSIISLGWGITRFEAMAVPYPCQTPMNNPKMSKNTAFMRVGNVPIFFIIIARGVPPSTDLSEVSEKDKHTWERMRAQLGIKTARALSSSEIRVEVGHELHLTLSPLIFLLSWLLVSLNRDEK